MTTILLLSLLAALFFVALILVALQRDYWRDRALYAEALEAQRAITAQQRPLLPYICRMMGLAPSAAKGLSTQPRKPTETEK